MSLTVLYCCQVCSLLLYYCQTIVNSSLLHCYSVKCFSRSVILFSILFFNFARVMPFSFVSLYCLCISCVRTIITCSFHCYLCKFCCALIIFCIKPVFLSFCTNQYYITVFHVMWSNLSLSRAVAICTLLLCTFSITMSWKELIAKIALCLTRE